METVIRTAVLEAPVDEVWAYFAAPQSWPEWDPDLVGVAESAEHGIVEGRTWDVAMKMPKKATLTFSNVSEGEEFTWTVTALGGMMHGVGRFAMEAADEKRTDFTYEFGMAGLLGKALWRFNRKAVLKGVDDGLENICESAGRS